MAYAPNSQYAAITQSDIDLSELGQQAQAVFEGQTGEVLQALVVSGNSGGARPKALIYAQPGNWANCSTASRAGDEAWLVKFTSASLPLGHEEGICEAVYLQLAEQLQLEPPQHTLVQPGYANREYPWLALKRFDWVSNHEGPAGRLHMHSACGLLGADFRLPSLDYQTLISATRRLCKSPAAAQLQFRRAVFNLLASNQDDHSKNWAFLQNDQGHWQPAPFYDVTFSPHPHGEHSTA
ncbi:HipA domain-containing protein, partial [Synechococcus sp. BA-120 BA3]|nr:HipA domain-containing protein [Synechococcus sp. BA-120 BA3]